MPFKSLSKYSKPEEAFLDEDLAKLGDALVNLIYSLSKSLAQDKPGGARAPNRVLSEALTQAGLRNLAPSRVDSHRLGDVVEAIVAYAWLKDEIEIREAAEILSESLMDADFQNRQVVFKRSEEGFKNLLTTIDKRISLEQN